MKQPNLLFVEDELKVAAAVKKGLEENGFTVDHAPDGAIGGFLAETKEYDLILLDLNLPFKSGYEICRSLRQKGTAVPIIMVTAMSDIDKKISGFDAGADDYIVKPFDFRELLARIRVSLKRNAGLTSEKPEDLLLRAADLEMNLSDKTVTRQGIPISLTVREFNLLEFLMRRYGRVSSRSEISEHVWELNFDTGTNTVDVYINFLRKKIDKNFEPKLIHTKSGMGYYLKDISIHEHTH
ncbi:MAG: response regulator transcription factor [Saprospiraceae bacterium]|nr:response regulator transcription factor [Saprospiraceae bacterium]